MPTSASTDAVWKLASLSAMDLRKFIHVREVIEEQGAVALARMHIGAAKHPEAYA